MNIIIDKGNSFTKIGLFDNNDLIEKKIFNDLKLEYIKEVLKKSENVEGAILLAETDYNPAIKKFLEDSFYFVEMTEETKIPIKNKYKTPNTLGKDRIAASVGGKLFYSDKNLLVINTGTCITYNFTTTENDFLGGAISPGIKMRLKGLNLLAPKLPLLELNASFDKLVGHTTEESILSGVLFGIVSEINGIVETYKEEYPKFKAVLSGGDYTFFEKRINRHIFTIPDLVMTGLNVILEYNISKKNIL